MFYVYLMWVFENSSSSIQYSYDLLENSSAIEGRKRVDFDQTIFCI